MKPGDLLLGVLDFFAVILPGSFATWLVVQNVPRADLMRYLTFSGSGPDSFTLAGAFLLSSYTLGHFVFMAGSRLDSSYDRWRRRKHPPEKDKAFQAAEKLRNELWQGGEFTPLKWAKSYIQIHAAQARTEIDLFEAHSKFFRSLVVIAAAMSLHFFLIERRPVVGAGSVILGILAFQRYCDQRWKSTELAYATAVILHNKLGVASDSGNAPVTGD